MYESYWQLKQKPFENTADPRYYFPGESHQAALLKLRYAIESGRGGALLAGASGSGKTLLVQMLRGMLGEKQSPFAHLVFPQMACDELLAYLADQLCGCRGDCGGSGVAESIRRIEGCLLGESASGSRAVVVVDEAHLIDRAETLEALRLLMNFESSAGPAVTLVLVGQTGLLPTLERTPQLDERLGVKCLLRPFNERETSQYVVHRLEAAGAAREVFEQDSIPVLYTLTHGLARQINRLCDLALLIGFAEERRTISASLLESVSQELVAVVPE